MPPAQDLVSHTSAFPEPIRVNFAGVDVLEVPPNGQGIVALLALQVFRALSALHLALPHALQILRGVDLHAMGHNSADYLHHLIEVRRA